MTGRGKFCIIEGKSSDGGPETEEKRSVYFSLLTREQAERSLRLRLKKGAPLCFAPRPAEEIPVCVRDPSDGTEYCFLREGVLPSRFLRPFPEGEGGQGGDFYDDTNARRDVRLSRQRGKRL